MSKFEIGDLVLPLSMASEEYGVTCVETRYIGIVTAVGQIQSDEYEDEVFISQSTYEQQMAEYNPNSPIRDSNGMQVIPLYTTGQSLLSNMMEYHGLLTMSPAHRHVYSHQMYQQRLAYFAPMVDLIRHLFVAPIPDYTFNDEILNSFEYYNVEQSYFRKIDKATEFSSPSDYVSLWEEDAETHENEVLLYQKIKYLFELLPKCLVSENQLISTAKPNLLL